MIQHIKRRDCSAKWEHLLDTAEGKRQQPCGTYIHRIVDYEFRKTVPTYVLRSNPPCNIQSGNRHGPCSGQNLCGALSGATFIPGISYLDFGPLSEVLRSNPSRNIHSENQHGPCSGQNLCGALSGATFILGMSYRDFGASLRSP